MDEISKIVTEILLNSDTLFSLYASKMTMEETRKGLEAFVPRIHSFVQTYLCRKRYKLKLYREMCIRDRQWSVRYRQQKDSVKILKQLKPF